MSGRIYSVPLLLLLLLSAFSMALASYTRLIEQRANHGKATVIASQISNNLEVFSADRLRAVDDLLQNWPVHHANPVDWFNVRATTLSKMLPGLHDMLLLDAAQQIRWSIVASERGKLTGAALSSLGFHQTEPAAGGFYTAFYQQQGQPFTLVVKAIDPKQPAKGFVAASFDIEQILTVLVGALASDDLSFYLQDGSHALFRHGQIDPNAPAVSQHLSFAGRDWQFVIQAQQPGLNSALLVLLAGLLSALLVSAMLFRKLYREQQLQLQQQMFLAAADASPDAIALYVPHPRRSGDFELQHANLQVAALFKPGYQQLQQLSLQQLCHALCAASFWPLCLRVYQQHKSFDGIVAVDSAALTPAWLQVQIVKAGAGLVISLRDVSDSKMYEQQLKANEEKYRRLVEGIDGHFIYRLNQAGAVDFISHSVQQILGYSPAEFAANHLTYVLREPEQMAQIRAQYQQGIAPQPYQIEYKAKDGSKRQIEFRERPVLDEQGKVLAIEGIGRDVTSELLLQQKIRYQADHDQLTGLLNRYAFDQQLQQLLTSGQQAILCYIDMDQFKLVNDSCGHLAGDELLRHVASILATDLTGNDVLARIGGDEFCLIYPATTLAQATVKLQQLFGRISAFRFRWEQKIFTVAASIGVLELCGQQLNTVEVLKAADSACYFAKTAGRNRYHIVNTGAAELNHRQNELDLVSLIQQAIDQHQFELYYQRIVPLQAQGGGAHYEMLLRLKDPQGKAVSPAVFIPLAERFGLMQHIDRWVFNQVLDCLEAHSAHLMQLDKVAINLSGLSLGDEQFLSHILQRFATSPVPAAKICFEITETAAVTNMASASRFIQALKQIGVRFALDDFGAGMSSFSYLKNMAVDFVKIDGSFVRNMARDATDYAMVKAIAEIAVSLGKTTIAEFVADAEVSALLTGLGVAYGQGYALHQPEPWLPLLEQASVAPARLPALGGNTVALG